jgi:hypothetical protein
MPRLYVNGDLQNRNTTFVSFAFIRGYDFMRW